MAISKIIKPLGHRAYGSIPHLPGSRKGPGDRGLSNSQSALLTDQVRDKNDRVIVQEKLDGSNVAVAKISGEIVALIRAGYFAETSPHAQHHWFADWVDQNRNRFADLLKEGERCVGEWLAVAHGTFYKLPHEPFVLFDIMKAHERCLAEEVRDRARRAGFVVPREISNGPPRSIEWVLQHLAPSGHGAIGEIEGAVWRIERRGAVDFLGKFVQHEKIDGQYLKGCHGNVEDKFNQIYHGNKVVELSESYFHSPA